MDDPRRTAILELRNVSRQFVSGTLSFDEFQAEFGNRFCDLFDEDDPNTTVKHLPAELQTESRFYLKWVSAAANGFRNEAWTYGSLEQNGWIDKQAYHKAFSEEFHRLTLS